MPRPRQSERQPVTRRDLCYRFGTAGEALVDEDENLYAQIVDDCGHWEAYLNREEQSLGTFSSRESARYSIGRALGLLYHPDRRPA